MKVTDIDYEYFQTLLKKAEAFDNALLDKHKFYFVEQAFSLYIRTDESALINQFKTLNDRLNYWDSAIRGYCNKQGIHPSEFIAKYADKKIIQ
jgi:hypothetical protein